MKETESLGFLIEKLMKKKGVTQAKMCEDLQVNQGAFISMKKNNKFKVNTLKKIMDYLDNEKFDYLNMQNESITENHNISNIMKYEGINTYLTNLLKQKDETIIRLATENGALLKELGKCEAVIYA